MPDQNSFQERLKRLESKGPTAQLEPATQSPMAPTEKPSEFNYFKAIAVFGAVFAIGMVGLVVFTIQQTSG